MNRLTSEMASPPDSRDPPTGWLTARLPELLSRFLPQQRWYGGKSRTIAAVELEDGLWLPGAGVPCALATVTARYEEGAPERYALLVGFREDAGDVPIIGEVDARGTKAVEASGDASVLLALLRGLVSDQPVRGALGGRLEYAHATQAVKQLLAPGSGKPPAMVRIGADQSNTSVRVGGGHVFKLFRKLEDGENPQLELSAFLTTRTRFRDASQLEGSLTYEAPDGRRSTVGVLESWIENAGDGWSHVVGQLERVARGDEALGKLVRDASVLGSVTAEFHAALASDSTVQAFAPEPLTERDVETWRAAAVERAAQTVNMIERRRHTWPDEARRLGETLLRMSPDLDDRVSPPSLGTGWAFHKIRVHGDYHLGQTLKTRDGFAIIDFEGEPMRPLAERRRKQCALKDVAGMLRSYDYAVEAVARHARSGSSGGSARRLCDAFLEGYGARAAAVGATFLPAEPAAVSAWIAFFELEKALYEIDYEANNRPLWLHIPLRGVHRILRNEVL
jgi:maltose alpha-D-glucosyltransferase/alpha-amylase